MINSVAGAVGGFALQLAGSQGAMANLFPAPSWNPGSDGTGASFEFDLILINDNVIKARNNYMCANTIIHNNRYIQKAILKFPGALYEVWLPTGQRHLMCTGSFTLSPIGLNRLTPNDFFLGSESHSGANVSIGVNLKEVATLENPEGKGHVENKEVLPDAYKLHIKFKSCLANNMNTAVFQYYVKMTGYDGYKSDNPGDTSKDSIADQTLELMKGFTDKAEQAFQSSKSSTSTGGTEASHGVVATRGAKAIESMRMGEILDSEDFEEITQKFDEATYNKKLGKLRTDIGDQAVNSESAVLAIRKAQSTVNEIGDFLTRLYNAPDENMWYMEDPKDEIYTTLKPDYRKMLRDKYQGKMRELRSTDSKLKQETRKLSNVESQLST